jgi:hypothetical protein
LPDRFFAVIRHRVLFAKLDRLPADDRAVITGSGFVRAKLLEHRKHVS